MVELVSIIIPCYNSMLKSRELKGSIYSALRQQSCNVEVILVDDGSSDGTNAILRTFLTDGRVKLIEQENAGVSAARNAGLEAASGDWVFFLDADDVMDTYAVSTLLGAARADDDVVVGAYTVIYTDEDNRSRVFSPPHGDRQAMLGSLIRTDSALCSMCARLYRRMFLAEQLIWAPLGVKIGEDVLFNLQVFLRCRNFTTIDQPIYTYYLGGQSAMGSTKSDFFASQLPMLEGIGAFLRVNKMETIFFRAHLDTYIRQMRKGMGRRHAALQFSRFARVPVLNGVNHSDLSRKEKCYFMAVRYMPILTFFMP